MRYSFLFGLFLKMGIEYRSEYKVMKRKSITATHKPRPEASMLT